jgi:transposase
MACLTERPRGTYGVTTASSSPLPPSRTGWRRRGKKAESQVETDYLDWALADFSGYLAADELYDGPFCVLSAVDARQQRRLLYEVLDHNPTQVDILYFLARLNDQIRARSQAVLGITTDGSPLYPQPIALVFGDTPHQICEFHILKELTKAVLHALASIRKRLAAQAPKSRRGRPRNTAAAKRRQQRTQRIKQRVAELFEHRHLFVRHQLTASERCTLKELTHGEPHLKALRAIMDEVYRLFDRRCRTATALAKLTRLRRRLRRYPSLSKSLDKLKSPNLEKALTFLDDRLLPATSNAVERGNRRHRKMQQTVYRVRRQETLQGRMALDLQRDQQAPGRLATTATLHQDRRGT